MDYPNEFNIPVFPSWKSIALSRRVGIWISIVFFLIICTCGFILLGLHLKSNYPFLISVDLFTNEWSVITHPEKTHNEEIPRYQVIQEKLVSNYVNNWFSISGDMQINESRWEKCTLDDCTDAEQYNPQNINCAMFCMSSDLLFEQFSSKVVPEYMALIKDRDERWVVGDMLITSTELSENAGSWQVYATIHSSIVGAFNVLSFIEIGRDVNMYPANLGYFVKEFNAYRIVNETIQQ